MSFSFSIIYGENDVRNVEFIPREYDNLMVLLFDQGIEEWGDCKGRAWCGTCHIAIEGSLSKEIMSVDEQCTLEGLPNRTLKSRLACQIEADEQLDGAKFCIMYDY